MKIPNIVKVRYRDIPWEEAKKCSLRPSPKSEIWWEARRGKEVLIETPAVNGSGRTCGGPFYPVIDSAFDGNRKINICPCIAEIGD